MIAERKLSFADIKHEQARIAAENLLKRKMRCAGCRLQESCNLLDKPSENVASSVVKVDKFEQSILNNAIQNAKDSSFGGYNYSNLINHDRDSVERILNDDDIVKKCEVLRAKYTKSVPPKVQNDIDLPIDKFKKKFGFGEIIVD